ncbi:hypothetical protein BS50DRAFT_500130 [Corynespora cassiicola Philippines]|uniref:Heterokaryon incompatibility domain-containing protein n=1 Tax=Corynespora cassiicola Philippines TaxID=1448308 RepID=A0A2T2NEF7_CORCC|nr:hypothetical protein BS50DRAFT_500130 [Corynespora cassiicola Philippines]
MYASLTPRSYEIRLLEIQPGTWADEVEVKLRISSISRARNRYVTISYTWGAFETTKRVFITCDGRQVLIPENLAFVLRRIRRPDFSVLVWADAICINQNDDFERTHQVGLMGEIYRNSRETIIWLGEQTDIDDVGQRYWGDCMTPEDREAMQYGAPPRIAWQGNSSDERLLNAYLSNFRQSSAADRFDSSCNDVAGAFCLIQRISEGTSTLDVKFLANKTTVLNEFGFSKYPGSISPFYRSNAVNRVFSGLNKLMTRAWWTRIWVIQETVLAQKATVHFGMLSAPWSMFALAARNYQSERHEQCLDLGGMPGYDILHNFSTSVLKIHHVRNNHQNLSETETLFSLLWKFRSLEASDKRDKVYALIGLATNWQNLPPMIPNYQKDVGTTYIDTVISLIRRSGDLMALTGDLDAGLGRKRLRGIPSWVMDWSLPCLQLEVDRVNSLIMYNSSGHTDGVVRFHQLHSILEVEGACVDVVIMVGDASRHTQISDTCAVIRKWNLMVNDYKNYSPEYPYPSGGSYHEAFWRTLIGDVVHTGHIGSSHGEYGDTTYRRATKDDEDAFDAWRMWSRCISRDTLGRSMAFTQRDLDEGISSIHYALKTATASRRFFITRNGYVGIGPNSTLPGDRLYVVQNSRVPFLVRSDSLKDCKGMGWISLVEKDGATASRTIAGTCEAQHSCSRLVGDCFAYGLMDGEIFKRSDVDMQRLFLV